ncbi:MAG: protein-S-isoprenylcysteine O-methyltransferase [Pseudomonadota bacterium]
MDDPATQPATGGSDAASGRTAIIGAQKSQTPLVPLIIILSAIAIYLWRSDFAPRWPMIIGAVLILVQMFIRGPFAKKAGSVTVSRDYVYRLDLIIMFGVFVTMVLLPTARLVTPWLDTFDYQLGSASAVMGVIISIFSLWLFYRSHADLGKQWSATLQIGEEHQLVTNGVYARIRHPMYSALWLYALAQPLLFQNWIAGPPVILVWAMLYFSRLPREERMMEEQFGKGYDDYRKHAGALWPRMRS